MATKREDKEGAERSGNAEMGEPTAETGRQAAEAGRQATETGTQASERIRRANEQSNEAMMGSSRHIADGGFNQAAEIGRRQVDQIRSMMGTSTRVYDDMADASRGDMDALMQSSARLAKGVQDMSWEVMQYTQQSLQLGMKTANDLMTCRSVEDMMNVQRNFVRLSVDTFLQESARLLEMSSHVATDAVDPLQHRVQDVQH